MKFVLIVTAGAALLLSFTGARAQSQSSNVLTPEEAKGGWSLLFDGQDMSQWRGAYEKDFPARGWVVQDGELRGKLSGGMESGDGGDIVTKKIYGNFEMVFDWKLGPGGNSGVKYFIEEREPKPAGSQPGYEYQIIDDANYIYLGKHLDAVKKTGAIYDVVAPHDKGDTAMDVWHTSRIRVRGDHIEHWLDGVKILDVDRKSAAFRDGVAKSKFKDYPNFGGIQRGHILLQDHGHNVSFRNLKIRELQ
jgi:hypothetical protein